VTVSRIKLSVLDACVLHRGDTAHSVLSETLAQAKWCETLGYERYWLTEHHAMNLAHSNPELLLAIIGSHTKKIRIGIAGVLLSLYPPLRVADTYRTLAAMFTGRVDLGIARGLPSISRLRALTTFSTIEEAHNTFAHKAETLIRILRREHELSPIPTVGANPAFWFLGSNQASAELASRFGAGYCHALFLNQDDGTGKIMDVYRDEFRPAIDLESGITSIGIAGVCAETEAAAKLELARFEGLGVRASIIGTPTQCRERIEEICSIYHTDEAVFLSLGSDFQSRRRSLEMLADAFRY
jgi:luciferase family oxidoreductase group 1